MSVGSRTSLTVAMTVFVLMGVGHLFVPFMPDTEKIPPVVVFGDVALGALSLVAAFGVLKRARWGFILTLIIAALNVLSAAPGVVAAPNTALHVVAAVYLVLSLVIIPLVLSAWERKPSAQRGPA